MQTGVLKAFPAKSCNKFSFLGWRAHASKAGKSLAQMPCKARHSRAVRKRPTRTSQSFEFGRTQVDAFMHVQVRCVLLAKSTTTSKPSPQSAPTPRLC